MGTVPGTLNERWNSALGFDKLTDTVISMGQNGWWFDWIGFKQKYTYCLTFCTRLLVFTMLKSLWFLKIQKSTLRFAKPILGMYVLIEMHFSLFFQQQNTCNEILKLLNVLVIFLPVFYTHTCYVLSLKMIMLNISAVKRLHFAGILVLQTEKIHFCSN